MRYLSRDSFARVDHFRKSIRLSRYSHKTCEWCGNEGKTLKDGERVLYQYGYQDDNGREYFSPHLFCCKSCYNAYSQ